MMGGLKREQSSGLSYELDMVVFHGLVVLVFLKDVDLVSKNIGWFLRTGLVPDSGSDKLYVGGEDRVGKRRNILENFLMSWLPGVFISRCNRKELTSAAAERGQRR